MEEYVGILAFVLVFDDDVADVFGWSVIHTTEIQIINLIYNMISLA